MCRARVTILVARKLGREQKRKRRGRGTRIFARTGTLATQTNTQRLVFTGRKHKNISINISTRKQNLSFFLCKTCALPSEDY